MSITTFKFADAKAREGAGFAKTEGGHGNTFHCLVVCPEGKVFEDDLDYVQAPGKEGSFGVLARHSPFVSQLKKGVVILKRGSQELLLEIPAGVLEVSPNNEVLILCEAAQLANIPNAATQTSDN